MRKKLIYAAAAVFFFAVSFYMPHEASAVPAFARQTGMACNSCHFQHFPTLNAFGRAFKAGGYTMIGGQSMVEGEFLSIPAVLNASLVTKVRYQKTNGDDEGGRNKGELQFPDEAALLIGGRAGEHIGFLLEASLKDGDSRFASYKMPINYTVANTNLSVIPFSTDAGGASYGFELLNTGAIRMSRPIEHRAEISAQQYLATDGAATGFSIVASRDLYFANYTAWANVHGDTTAGPYLSYARLAFTPTVAGWDLGAGVQWWGGTSTSKTSTTTTRARAAAWAIDAQAQGLIASFPVGFYISYGVAEKNDAGDETNIFNSSTVDDKVALGTLVEVGVVPNRLTVSAGYLTGKGGVLNGNSTEGTQNAVTLGANYQLAQNVNLVWNTSLYSGGSFDPKPASRGDQLTTLMVFAAF